MVYHVNAYYIFGGLSTQTNGFGVGKDTIARLDMISSKWSLAGTLRRKRGRHNIIQDGASEFLVIGGNCPGGDPCVEQFSERCSIMHDTVNCTEQMPLVLDSYEWPALFWINADVCQK